MVMCPSTTTVYRGQRRPNLNCLKYIIKFGLFHGMVFLVLPIILMPFNIPSLYNWLVIGNRIPHSNLHYQYSQGHLHS